MIITTAEELRMNIPAHALDDVSSLTGFIENSENDFLKDKLGDALFLKLKEFYKTLDNPLTLIGSVNDNIQLGYYEQLLQISQRIVSFDAMARAISVQAISVNGAGVNVATPDDYPKADEKAVLAFKNSCTKEAHSAVNYLLQTLEQWAKIVETKEATDELKEIVSLWKDSRYYFLAANLLIPSAQVLQEYLNIYDSREKFIQMLPDLRNVQEDLIAPSVGEDFLDELISVAIKGTKDRLLSRIIHKLRKAMAAGLEERTNVLKIDAGRKQKAHDERIFHIKSVVDILISEKVQFMENKDYESFSDAYKTTPFFKETIQQKGERFENNEKGNVMFVMPGLH